MEGIAVKIRLIVQNLYGLEVWPIITRPDPQFGDYATNVALQIAKQISKNPREVANEIADLLSGNGVTEVTVAGPGFINMRLSDALLIELTGARPRPIGGAVVIETNNPNPFKAMHIGHALNSIVADTVANLLDAAGRDVHRVSYHGDVGAHVGKSMYSLLRFVDGDPERLQTIAPEDRNSFMSRMYAEGSAAYKNDPAAKETIDQLAKDSFTREDPVYAAVYDTCKQWSFDQIDALVARMGNKPIERRYLESQADALGVTTAQAHVGDVFIESDGALVFPGSKYGTFDNVFVSSAGRGLYAARDLGLMQLKHRDYPAAVKSYIVTADEQREYFNCVIKAAELALPELRDMTVNIPTGIVKLTTGKMSSRSGDVLEIGWLFDQIAAAVAEAGSSADEQVIAGALRYEFLRVRIGSDIIFDVNEAVSVKGNSGPYLQYAHARARSVLAKDAKQVQQNTKKKFEPAERALLLKLSEYGEVLQKATEELLPHYICTYLYELAQEFNRFYEHNRVIGDPRQAQRLWLVERYADTLKEGLSVLGIHAPDRM